MEHVKVKLKTQDCSTDYKLEVYTNAYYLVWNELKQLKMALGLDPIKLVTEEQYAKIRSRSEEK